MTISADPLAPLRRADAVRNRQKILSAARLAFDEPHAGEVSMAEVARRAGVGMATLYRNFPGKMHLLEALFVDEVDEVCAAAAVTGGRTAGDRLSQWLRQFFDFAFARNAVATELIAQSGGVDNPLFNDDRNKFCAAGRPLLASAQSSGEFRTDLDIGQMLDLMVAVARVHGDATYVRPIAEAAIDGLRTTTPSV